MGEGAEIKDMEKEGLLRKSCKRCDVLDIKVRKRNG
jgi:hypothetical protein